MRIPFSQLPCRIAFLDPAGGKASIKKTRARSAIVVVTQDWLERVYLLFAWAGRVSTDHLYEKIFEVQTRYAPDRFGIESSAQQSLFVDGVRREARQRGVRLAIVGVHQATNTTKAFRNRTAIQPVLADGRFFHMTDQVEAVHELATHPMNPLCDIVDALASAIAMLPKRTAKRVGDHEVLALARYLRRSGASPAIIERYTALKRHQLQGERNATEAAE